MGKIHKLSPLLADMIAAGEVVERPASVIKELVENAIDAGAKKITVEIKNGGVTFMRVTDDGCGMSREDASTAFLRHATSKISTAEDLSAIGTMGFRGEALAAISAVSRMEVLTRTEEDEFGTSVRVEAGNVMEVSPAGGPRGTTMIVRDLFYNTPARMKFLKRDSVESGYISGVVQRQALGHPEIAFRFIRDGKNELSTPGDGKLLSAIYAAMGRSAAVEMVEVNSSSGGVGISGYVGKPTASRGSRSFQHFFVNGRHVKSGMMAAALEEAYKNQIMTARFPICVLHVEVAPTAVDVNVHPAKTEVKFLREADVFDAIHYGVLGALSRASGKVEMTLPKAQPKAQPKQEFFKSLSAQEYRTMTSAMEKSSRVTPDEKVLAQFASLQQKAERKENGGFQVRDSAVQVPRVSPRSPERQMPLEEEVTVSKPRISVEQNLPPVEEKPLPMEPEQISVELPKVPAPAMPEPPKQEMPKKPRDESYRIIGQALDTYIIVEQGDSLLLIDKHAAHERILFEKFKAREHKIMSQMLLTPLQLDFAREEASVLLENRGKLEALGFEAEDYGDGTLLIRAIPADIDEDETESTLSQLAQDLMEGRQVDEEAVFDHLLHTVACKAAIKGGRRSDPRELSALVAELMAREDIKYCPHGRPVCVTLSRNNLERQFKRQV